MFKLFRAMSAKKIGLFILINFMLAAGIIVLYIYRLINQTLFTVLLFIVLISISFLTSALTERSFNKRLDKKRMKRKFQINKSEVAFLKPFKVKTTNFGEVSTYNEKNTLFILNKVKKPELFFSEEQEKYDLKIDFNKYKYVLQFYIFEAKDYELIKKIRILNYQAKKFYIASFIYYQEDNLLVQTDDVKPNLDYEVKYQEFINLLDGKEI